MTAKLPSMELGWGAGHDFRKSGRVHTAGTEFGKLEAEWYAKLAASGFVDIEPPPVTLKKRSYLDDHWLATASKHVRGCETGAAEIYRLVTSEMDSARFPSRSARVQAALHLSGHTHRGAKAVTDGWGMAAYGKLGPLVKDMLAAALVRARSEDADADDPDDDMSWVAVTRGGRTRQEGTE